MPLAGSGLLHYSAVRQAVPRSLPMAADLSPSTLGLFAVVAASWVLVLLAWVCQHLTGFPPAPPPSGRMTSSAAERQPLLTPTGQSQVQPGRDEANHFLFFCAILASIGMGLQSFNGNFTAVSLAVDCSSPGPGTAAALNCQLKISDQLVSVYAAIPALAAIPGAFVGGAFVDRVGRKRIMVLACLPFVAGWVLTALAPTPTVGGHRIDNTTHQIDSSGHALLTSETVLLLLAGRILLGFGGGLSIPGIGPWITESAPPDLRGAFATIFQVLAVSGIAVMYVFGLVLRWRGIAVSGGVMCFVYALLLTTLPESPRWLLAHGREADARVALQQLRTTASDIDTAFGTMKREHEAEQQAAKGAGFGALMAAPATRKAMLISMCLMTLQNLSGVNAVFLYLGGMPTATSLLRFAQVIRLLFVELLCLRNSGDILQPIFKTPDAANLATLPVAAGLISFTLLAAGLMDRAGRVKLLLISSIGKAQHR